MRNYRLIDKESKIIYKPISFEKFISGDWQLEGEYYQDTDFDKKGKIITYTYNDFICDNASGNQFIWQEGTGLMDTIGNELFVGDIVQYSVYYDFDKDFSIGKIIYRKDKYLIQTSKNSISIYGNKYMENKIPNSPKKMKVIGNIEINPELLG